ncbi:MAG: sigma-70 family RNA polymerase sigma factor [Elusimicrobia bacterium]|nr:sigma-70 family RNA polymerase sigma factor [Elusimicrobiota bacterium]
MISEDEDIKCMLAFRAGGDICFEKILKKYEKPLINFVYRFIGNKTEAEDIAQEVFLRVYKSKNKYEPRAKFSTWLYRIAANICIDYRRKPANKLHASTDSLDKPIVRDENEITSEIADASKNLQENILEQKLINETIMSALILLPTNQRIALTLCVYENKSYREISEILGCSVSSVESLLFRSRQTLRKNWLFYKKNDKSV